MRIKTFGNTQVSPSGLHIQTNDRFVRQASTVIGTPPAVAHGQQREVELSVSTSRPCYGAKPTKRLLSSSGTSAVPQ